MRLKGVLIKVNAVEKCRCFHMIHCCAVTTEMFFSGATWSVVMKMSLYNNVNSGYLGAFYRHINKRIANRANTGAIITDNGNLLINNEDKANKQVRGYKVWYTTVSSKYQSAIEGERRMNSRVCSQYCASVPVSWYFVTNNRKPDASKTACWKEGKQRGSYWCNCKNSSLCSSAPVMGWLNYWTQIRDTRGNLGIELWEEVEVSLEISSEDSFNDDEAELLEVGVVEVDKPREARIRLHQLPRWRRVVVL